MQPGWMVKIVKCPSKWRRYPIDVTLPPMPRWKTLPRWWVVEHTIGRYRQISKDYDKW
jgi:hypothetical protein